MKPDEFKSLVATLSNIIDARAKTTETLFKAEIKGSEDRLSKRVDEAKEELRAELATKEQVAQLGIAIHQVDTNLVRKVHKQERRIENLEEKTGSPNPDKH